MSTTLSRISELAKGNRTMRFLSIAHLLTVGALVEAFYRLRKDASAGVDGVTYAAYEADAWENLEKLHDRIKSGRYRAEPLRRIYIPKEDGRQRPISIPSLEDKVLQRATFSTTATTNRSLPGSTCPACLSCIRSPFMT